MSVRELASLLGAEVVGPGGLAEPGSGLVEPDSGLVGPDSGLVGPDRELDAEVTGLVVDSRQVGAGSLFLALPGEHVDGHDYVAAAFARGAVAALTGRPVAEATGPCLVVPDPLLAAGRLARDQVDRATAGGLRTAALTGSAGKTSTKDLLAQLLEAAGPTVAPVGNLNNELGLPLTVCRIRADTRFLVAEMGARGIGHIAYLCGIVPPRVAAVLNVGTAHVGEFGGQQQIAIAKGEIVEALPADGTAVLNADDPLVWAMRSRTPTRVVAASATGEPDWPDAVWATDIVADALGRCSFVLHQKGSAEPSADPVRIQLGVAGHHQVDNAVIAVGMARALGVDHATVVEALPAARPRSRWRMELTERPDGVLIVNDAYNANPESMHAALDTVEEILAGRIAAGQVGVRGWGVLGDMLELGDSAAAEHRALGRYATQHGISRLVAIGSFADEIVAGAVAAGAVAADAASVGNDLDAAVRLVSARLAPGDVVLVKASRGLALDTVAAALAAVTPDGRDDQRGRDDESGADQPGPDEHRLDEHRLDEHRLDEHSGGAA